MTDQPWTEERMNRREQQLVRIADSLEAQGFHDDACELRIARELIQHLRARVVDLDCDRHESQGCIEYLSAKLSARLTWRPITEAPRPDENPPLVWIFDGFNKARWIARWDPNSGYFRGIECIEDDWMTADRLYGATHWAPLEIPDPPPLPDTGERG